MKLAIAFPLVILASTASAQMPIPAGPPLCNYNGFMAPCPPSYTPRERENYGRRDAHRWSDEELQRREQMGRQRNEQLERERQEMQHREWCNRHPWKCQ